MAAERDPIQPWFEALEAMGEYSGIRFGRVDETTGEVEWIDMSHKYYDGLGGFAKILRDRQCGIGSLPRIPHLVKESWWPFVKNTAVMLLPRKRLGIDTGENSSGDSLDYGSAPKAFAWHVFSEDETSLLRKASRVLQISVNSLLLRHLDRTIRSDIEDPSALVNWMVPVNLRGKVSTGDDTANHSSYLSVRLSASESPLEVHKQIYRKLRNGEHWANWKAYKLGRYCSEKLKIRIIKSDRGTARWNIGSFSNLGIWDSHKEIGKEGCKGPWLFAPPVLETVRIGAGCITFQNRLSLMIQAHPALTTDASVTKRWMREWLEQIRIDMISPRMEV